MFDFRKRLGSDHLSEFWPRSGPTLRILVESLLSCSRSSISGSPAESANCRTDPVTSIGTNPRASWFPSMPWTRAQTRGPETIHDLRHSFASRAFALGENLPMIGRLLGHSELQVTGRYAHLDSDWMREAVARISESIAAEVLTGYPGQQDEVSPIVAGAVRATEETVPAAFHGSWFCRRATRAA